MPSPERRAIEGFLQIVDKDKRAVPMKLNPVQATFDEEMTGRDHVPKARQMGISSYVLALFTIRCLSRDNTRAVVISHDKESTERLFAKVRFFIDNFRGPRPETGFASKRELTFPKTGSSFYIGTAGARKFGRGDTITDLHCSEVAFWDDPGSLTAGLFQSVPRKSGTIILESTGNGREWYYRRVMRAEEGKSRYRNHFFGWLEFPEYNIVLSEKQEQEVLNTLDVSLDEPELVAAGWTPGQIQFRREKLDDMDFDTELFKQEYPTTLDECFRSTGASIFNKVLYEQTENWQKSSRFLSVLYGHPNPSYVYAIGADVSGGVGKDRSVAHIGCLTTNEQVGEWVSDRCSPDDFAKVLAELGRAFNHAYITVESNNHGILTLSDLRGLYPIYLIHKVQSPTQNTTPETALSKLGVLSTSRTRPLLIGSLRRAVATVYTIHSPLLKDEMDTFVEKETGKMEAQEGSFDDRVIAAAAMQYSWERAALLLTPRNVPSMVEAVDPFSFEGIVEEMRLRGKRVYPMESHIRSVH